MPDYLSRKFAQVNDIIEATRAESLRLASQFTTDSPRDQVMAAHRYVRGITIAIAEARQMTGIATFASEQWGQPALDFIAKAQEIEAAADDVADFIEANFPTVLSTLNAAMTAVGMTVGQQNSLRTQMGGNVNYLLTQQFVGSVLTSPTIPAAQLAPLVTRMNTLAAAATI